MKKLLVVGCGKSKQASPAKACELYTGGLTRARIEYAKQAAPGAWAIASAKHGLVMPDQVVEPYDATLSNLDAQGRTKWGRAAAEAIRELACAVGASVVELHLSGLYAEALRCGLAHLGLAVEAPTHGLALPQLKAWYAQRKTTTATTTQEPAPTQPEPDPAEVDATPATPTLKLAARHEKMLARLRQEGGQIRNPESSSWRGTLCDLERAGLVSRRYERCVGGQRTVWALVDQATPAEASPELAEVIASEPAQEVSAAPAEGQPQEVQPQVQPLPSPPKDRVRDPHDRYYTPRRAALPVRELWGKELRGRVVVEPCVGRGDLAAVLEEAGARVVTADVVAPEQPATRDLFGHVVRQPDLLGDLLDPAHRARLARLAPQAEWVVTNPPFSLIADVVRAALELAPRVLVLIPWGWLGLYSDRAELMRQVRRVVVVGRINFLDPQGRRSDQVNRDQVAWVEFGREGREGSFPVSFWRKP